MEARNASKRKHHVFAATRRQKRRHCVALRLEREQWIGCSNSATFAQKCSMLGKKRAKNNEFRVTLANDRVHTHTKVSQTFPIWPVVGVLGGGWSCVAF